FMELDVPPTLVSFAICVNKAKRVLSPEFKGAGHPVYLFAADGKGDEPDYVKIKETWDSIHELHRTGKILAAWACDFGGAAEGILKMSVGNDVGFQLHGGVDADILFENSCGSILVECSEIINEGMLVGCTTSDGRITLQHEQMQIEDVKRDWENVFEDVFPTRAGQDGHTPRIAYGTRSAARKHSDSIAKPRAVIPVFPGTNCEYDTARAIERAGGSAEILVIKNLDKAGLEQSVEAFASAVSRSQMVVLPGGFSGGDEPEGSGKFIASFLRN
ncbi:MAG: phosphoribosylformylglycinamidine synthase subunit PurQ, partial [Clostridia bacterium]